MNELVANAYGYRLRSDLTALSLSGFADDQVASSSSMSGLERIVELVGDCFNEIGLEINAKKSVAIIIEKGKLIEKDLVIDNKTTIKSLKTNDRIRYLGCSFESELVFDHHTIEKLTNNMNSLLQTPLQKDQKMNILNQYLLPQLTYPLQAAPLNKIPKYHFDTLDSSIRQTVKGIIGLPTHHTPNSMLYAPRKYHGLGIVNARKEVLFQYYSIAKRLSAVDDQILTMVL